MVVSSTQRSSSLLNQAFIWSPLYQYTYRVISFSLPVVSHSEYWCYYFVLKQLSIFILTNSLQSLWFLLFFFEFQVIEVFVNWSSWFLTTFSVLLLHWDNGISLLLYCIVKTRQYFWVHSFLVFLAVGTFFCAKIMRAAFTIKPIKPVFISPLLKHFFWGYKLFVALI